MNMQESGEMYLETILVLKSRQDTVRAIDIAEDMGFSKPSVSRALSILREEKYISVDGKGFISLTRKGSQVAKKIYERHVVLSDMLIALGVDKKTALEDACRVEHVISDRSFAAIKKRMAEYKKG
ncbi:MAG: metal-dependent transcriptional regulator [Spirochaetia bacterium]|nr:metal-dependent transcriptional regulator [Spirochaetia bacterium]MBO7094454.1 metal-dependent transcriptional regulator [Spirochaetia bacterium]MBO7517417.1 metal-dependent transcriptional regulator [Spirochaetia bacterium]MBP5739890.1 metal-dependent transcriptional regulator [Spirochaetia bacterium]